MSDDVRKAVGLVEDLDTSGIDFELFKDTIFRVSLSNAGLISTQVFEAIVAENRTPDQQALFAIFGPRGADRHAR